LEVSLINLLAEKSPILLAGDDDQALYDFKNASAEHIRTCHSGSGSPYAAFNLPFCARCTRVIIEATNDVILAAQKRGLLKGRIDKPYLYFDHKEKDAESTRYARIGYKQAYARQIPWAIGTEIKKMAEDVRGLFSVLVIAATSTQCRDITSALQEKGFDNCSYVQREAPEPTLMDGLRLLLEDKNDDLGWRIVAGCLLKEADFAKTLKAVGTNKRFVEGLEKSFKVRVLESVRRLRQLNDDSIADDERGFWKSLKSIPMK
jgi:superfamily I DNA/RNA helicase